MFLTIEENIIVSNLNNQYALSEITKDRLINYLKDMQVNSYNDISEDIELREYMKETIDGLIDKIKPLKGLQFRELINSIPLINELD